jgi:hypothetical protein
MSIETNTTAELETLRLPELQARFREVVGEITRSPNRTFLIRRITEALAAKASAEVAVEVEPTIAAPEVSVEEAGVQAPSGTALAEATTGEPVETAESKCQAEECDGCDVCEPADDEVTTNPRPKVGGAVEGAVAEPESKKRGRFSAMSIEELQAKYLEVVGRATGSSDRGYLIWKIREAEKGRITVGPRQTRTTDGNTDEAKALPLRLDAPAITAMDTVWREQGIPSRTEFLLRAIGHYLTHLGATDAAALFGAK